MSVNSVVFKLTMDHVDDQHPFYTLQKKNVDHQVNMQKKTTRTHSRNINNNGLIKLYTWNYLTYFNIYFKY